MFNVRSLYAYKTYIFHGESVVVNFTIYTCTLLPVPPPVAFFGMVSMFALCVTHNFTTSCRLTEITNSIQNFQREVAGDMVRVSVAAWLLARMLLAKNWPVWSFENVQICHLFLSFFSSSCPHNFTDYRLEARREIPIYWRHKVFCVCTNSQ